MGGGAPQPLLHERLDDALFGAVAISGTTYGGTTCRCWRSSFRNWHCWKSCPWSTPWNCRPCAFRNPYHALEKDYKPTGRERTTRWGMRSSPASFSAGKAKCWRSCGNGIRTCIAQFTVMRAGVSGRLEQGYALVFGGPASRTESVVAAMRACAGRNGCQTAAARLEIPAAREERMGLAYVLAWLAVAGDCRSVLPGWVWRQFPPAREWPRHFGIGPAAIRPAAGAGRSSMPANACAAGFPALRISVRTKTAAACNGKSSKPLWRGNR